MSVEAPEGWEALELGQVLDVLRNGVSCKQAKVPDIDNDVPVSRIETISNGSIDPQRVGYAQYQDVFEKYKIKKGDILFSHINSIKHIGKIAFSDRDQIFYHAMNLMLLRSNKRVDPRYLFEFLRSDSSKKYFETNAKPAVNQASLNRANISALPLLLPPLPEQQKIAEILISVDDAIQATEAVIEQTKKVKQGVMSQLLTKGIGHTRFKQTEIGEIPEAWEVCTLGKIGKWLSGGTPSKANAAYWSGDIPWVSPKDMKTPIIRDSIDHVSEDGVGNGTRLIQDPALLIVVRGMVLAKTVPVAVTACPVTFNQDIKAVIPKPEFSVYFVRYWLEHRRHDLMGLVASSTHGTKRLPQEDLEAFLVPKPSREEQDKIVDAIASFDQQAQRNEMTVVQMRRQKAGLMSDLLTGRRRAKVTHVE